jgi:hypothetical protein
MKLGIVVVYLFNEKSAPLLDVHLRHIAQHTQAPYVIYAGVNRLAPAYRQRLAEHPNVRLCACPETDLRGGPEHAFYLEHLVKRAIEDGVTHIVTLHLDSFPIRSGWAEELAGRLSDTCALATIDRINTACLFFRRDFYLTYHPTFLLSEAERADPTFRQYLAEHDPAQHSGIGYGFTAYANGLSWYYLKRDAPVLQPQSAWTFDGLIFHVGGAVRLGEGHAGVRVDPDRRRLYRWLMAARFLLPPGVRAFLWARAGALGRSFKERMETEYHVQNIEQFVQHPELLDREGNDKDAGPRLPPG